MERTKFPKKTQTLCCARFSAWQYSNASIVQQEFYPAIHKQGNISQNNKKIARSGQNKQRQDNPEKFINWIMNNLNQINNISSLTFWNARNY
jgi:hypothetical protein